jgi:cell division protein ZapA
MDDHNTEIIIDGKVYVLNGAEETEYLQTVASYVNDKISELKKDRGYTRLGSDYQSVLLAMNLADDVFQARRLMKHTDQKLDEQEKDAYQIRHDLVTAQLKIQSLEEQCSKMQEEKTALRNRTRQEMDEEKTSWQSKLDKLSQELEDTKAQLAGKDEELEAARRKITLLEEYKYRK